MGRVYLQQESSMWLWSVQVGGSSSAHLIVVVVVTKNYSIILKKWHKYILLCDVPSLELINYLVPKNIWLLFQDK